MNNNNLAQQLPVNNRYVYIVVRVLHLINSQRIIAAYTNIVSATAYVNSNEGNLVIHRVLLDPLNNDVNTYIN